MKIDVMIPVYKPGACFHELIARLEKQTYAINRIILMNTEQAEFEKLADTEEFLQAHPRVGLFHLKREEFDHGATRNEGVRKSDADVFVCMTQDAMPADECLIGNLVKALSDREDVAAAYARQLPEEDCGVIERYTRQFNYPDASGTKGKEDIPVLGIKTFFCSNVCAAYRRDVFDRLGGFVGHTIFNEDMIYAACAVKAGYRIAYAADAQVIHSHNYTARQQFARNFDLGVSHAQYPEIFAGIAPEGEGMKLVGETAVYLCRKHPLLLPRLVVHSGMKWLGYRLGKAYKKLPERLVKCFSMQKTYWK